MPNKSEKAAWEKQLVEQAEQRILSLTDSEKFKSYLDIVANFHRYSPRNVALIYAQNPHASQVAGFNQWRQAFKRTVKKSEKGIRIAAPIVKKLTEEEQKSGCRQLMSVLSWVIVTYQFLMSHKQVVQLF